MAMDEMALIWLLGYASAVAVFHCIGLTRPAPPFAERRSSIPTARVED
jgi:hypothetical protein